MSRNRKEIKVDNAANIKKPKDVIYDPRGQWKYPGMITRIPGGNITMHGVNYPVLGVDSLGNSQMMMPGMDYSFPGNYVTEYPMMQKGGIKYGTPEYAAAYRQGKIARQVGDEFILPDLPEAVVTGVDPRSIDPYTGERYAMWDQLSEDYKKVLNDPGSIGINARNRARSGHTSANDYLKWTRDQLVESAAEATGIPSMYRVATGEADVWDYLGTIGALGVGMKALSRSPKVKTFVNESKKTFKDIVQNLDNKYITPIQFKKEIKELKALVDKTPEYFSQPEVVERLRGLNINPFALQFKKPKVTHLSGRGSHYSSLLDNINIDFRQLKDLKKKGYELPLNTVYEHELAHKLQAEAYKNSPEFRKSFAKYMQDPRSNIKPFSSSNPTSLDHAASAYLRNKPSDDFGIDSYDYFHYDYSGRGKVEPLAHLREMRQNMINKGYIKNELDDISVETLDKFIKENPRDRMSSFLATDDKNLRQLKKLFDNLPVATGVGAGAYALQQKQDGGQKENYNMRRANELGIEPDSTGHYPSVDSTTGMWLKSKSHPTAWMEYLYGHALNPDTQDQQVVVNPEGYFEENQLQYIPKKDLEEYKRGGKFSKRYTNKNIKSSINELLKKRNKDLFGEAGRRYFKPYQNGGIVLRDSLVPTQDLTKKDHKVIKSLIGAISNGEPIQPIEVEQAEDGLRIKDGHHRYLAYTQLGIDQVPVKIISDMKKKKNGGEAFPQQPTMAQFFAKGFIPRQPQAFYQAGGKVSPEEAKLILWGADKYGARPYVSEDGYDYYDRLNAHRVGFDMGTTGEGYNNSSNADPYKEKYMPYYNAANTPGIVDDAVLYAKTLLNKKMRGGTNTNGIAFPQQPAARVFFGAFPWSYQTGGSMTGIDPSVPIISPPVYPLPLMPNPDQFQTPAPYVKPAPKVRTPVSIKFGELDPETNAKANWLRKQAARESALQGMARGGQPCYECGGYHMQDGGVSDMSEMYDAYESSFRKGGWIQKATESIKRRGTEGVCTGAKFGSSSCPPGSKRYNLAKTFRAMAKNRQEGGQADGLDQDDYLGNYKRIFMDKIKSNTMDALATEAADQFIAQYGAEVNPMTAMNNQMLESQMAGIEDKNRGAFGNLYGATMNAFGNSNPYMQQRITKAQQGGNTPSYLTKEDLTSWWIDMQKQNQSRNYSPSYQSHYNPNPTGGGYNRFPANYNAYSQFRMPQVNYNPNNTFLQNYEYRGRLFGQGPRKVSMTFRTYKDPQTGQIKQAPANNQVIDKGSGTSFLGLLSTTAPAGYNPNTWGQGSNKPASDAWIESNLNEEGIYTPQNRYGGYYAQNGLQMMDNPDLYPYIQPQVKYNQPVGEFEDWTVTEKFKRNMRGEDKANWALAGIDAASALMRNRDYNRMDAEMSKNTLADNAMTVMPANQVGKRGRYNWTGMSSGMMDPANMVPIQQPGQNYNMEGFVTPYQEGGVYDLSEEEIDYIMRNGGSVTYVD